MAISTARLFFDQAIAGGAAFLEKLVTDQAHETEWLDFKGGREEPGSEQVKGLWSKAICGFANNQGGCIVWGIDARKDPDTNIDAANEVVDVKDPAVLRSRLMELHPRATEPPVAGVESVAIHLSGNSGPGFVLSYVPESDAKPHRAENLKNTPYIIRIGDSFVIPSPSILRNLFYPRSSPQLLVRVDCDWETPRQNVPPPEMEVYYRVYLKNTSVVTARDVFVIVKGLPHGISLSCPFGVIESATEFGTGIELKRALHPHNSVPIGIFRHTVGISHSVDGFRPGVAGRVWSAYFQIFAENMIPSRQQVAFGDREVHERKKKEAAITPDFDTEFYTEDFRRD